MTEKFTSVEVHRFTLKNYKTYGVATLEDRAVPAYQDGFKPVHRRAVWAAYKLGLRSNTKFVKAARLIGDIIGKFHPHSDTGCYDAVVGITNVYGINSNTSFPMFDGSGNWGSFSDKSYAAMRYTEIKLSKFADSVVLNPFYTPVIETGPNYDSSEVEPLVLPALLPILFLNGTSGIATGASVKIPACTFQSVLKVLDEAYTSGKPLTSDFLYKNLRFTSQYGGFELPPKNLIDKNSRKDIFTKYKGSVTLNSDISYDLKTKCYTVTKFGSSAASAPKLVEALAKIVGVKNAFDDSTTSDKYGILKILLAANAPEPTLDKVKKVLGNKENYILNFTDRYIAEDGQLAAKVFPSSLTDIFNKWIKWRTDLEVKACSYWIAQAAKQIAKLDLLMLAVDNRKIIIESLDKDCDQKELELWLSKKLKISLEDAATIYDLKVRQLRKLERKDLESQKAEIVKRKKELEARKAKPMVFMAKQLSDFKCFLPKKLT